MRLILLALAAFLAGADEHARASRDAPESVPVWAQLALERICAAYRSGPRPDPARLAALIERPIISTTVERDEEQAVRTRFFGADGLVISVTASLPGQGRQRTLLVGSRMRAETVTPFFVLVASADCTPTSGDLVLFDERDRPDRIIHLSGRGLSGRSVEALNPDVPPGRDPGGVRVAHIDTGVAYDLPQIAGRLARDAGGAPLGYDFADGDDKPYDRDPAQPVLFARQQGTSTASILLAEAPSASLIPFRYPADDAESLARLPAEAARRGARIVMLPLASARRDLWADFAEAAARQPDMLFIVSAGSSGHDLAVDPTYPARLSGSNMLVVTSTETDGHIARGANWGAADVHIGTPAERLDILSPTGTPAIGSGPRYAVARIAALAARLLEASPDLDVVALRQAILERARPLPATETRAVGFGWIGDPANIQ